MTIIIIANIGVYMSISYIIKSGELVDTVAPLAGMSEINRVWEPIIRLYELHFLDYIINAGIVVGFENHVEIANELQVLSDCIQNDVSFQLYDHRSERIINLTSLIRKCDYHNKSIYIG
jgi:hypothetical protein